MVGSSALNHRRPWHAVTSTRPLGLCVVSFPLGLMVADQQLACRFRRVWFWQINEYTDKGTLKFAGGMYGGYSGVYTSTKFARRNSGCADALFWKAYVRERGDV